MQLLHGLTPHDPYLFLSLSVLIGTFFSNAPVSLLFANFLFDAGLPTQGGRTTQPHSQPKSAAYE